MTAPVIPMTREQIDALNPTYHGQTWRHNGPLCNAAGFAKCGLGCDDWLIPQRTLGWDIIRWVGEYLLDEEGGRFRLTAEQRRFLLWWYAVDESGRFTYRTGVLQRLKGWGKDPLGAVMCLVEFVGPARFHRWATAEDAKRNPRLRPGMDAIGKQTPAAWVQVAAVSREQTKNTMTLLPSLMSQRLIQDYGIKEGAELIRADRGRRRLEAVTSSYRALEGGRSTFVLLNETHHWIKGNNGHLMYETVDGNTTKKDSRYLAITNAYLPGEDSVAERMRQAYDDICDGLAPDVGFYYDSIEAHPKTPLTVDGLEVTLPKIRGDAVWLRIDAIIKSIQNSTISASRSRRMWLNQIVADEDSVYKIEQLQAIERPGAELKVGAEIVLGFDGGKTNDSTALVAIELSTGCAFLLAIWEKPAEWPKDQAWEVPHERVDSEVHAAFKVYKVKAFYADVAYWESYISLWNKHYGAGLVRKAGPDNPIGWDMRASEKRNTLAHERLMDAIIKGNICFDGDATLRRHAYNARRRYNSHGISFGKEDAKSPRKVDAYAAWMLAHEAMCDIRNMTKKQEPERSTEMWAF